VQSPWWVRTVITGFICHGTPDQLDGAHPGPASPRGKILAVPLLSERLVEWSSVGGLMRRGREGLVTAPSYNGWAASAIAAPQPAAWVW
jgi:hypothetical protein